MEAQVKVIEVLPERTGTSQEGRPWRIASYVVETTEPYNPKKFMIEVSDGENHRIEAMGLEQGKIVKLRFDIVGREFNGRWFNSIRAYGAIPVNTATPSAG